MHPNTHSRAIFLTMAVFVLQSLVMGGWFALIPHVQQDLMLSKAQLAIALLGSPVALIFALQFAGKTVARFGARKVFIAMFPLQGVTVMFPLLATGAGSLFIMLMALGAAIGFLEVCLNTYAGRLEIISKRTIMNRCHGFWSLGLVIGSMGVTLLTPISGPFIALGLIAFVSAMGGLLAALSLPSLGLAGEGGGQTRRRKIGQVPLTVVLISILLLPVTMTEGAMADWAAIYLGERLPEGVAGAGFAVTIYASAMTFGRFVGDALNKRFGPVALARGTLCIGLLGLGMLVAPLPIGFAYAGFVFIGLGVSVTFPLGVSATAAVGQEYEAANIAIISTFAISGFLLGPPLIGFLAEWAGLAVGLSVLIPGLCISLLLSGRLAPNKKN